MSDKPDISIIIPAYNEEAILRDTIDAAIQACETIGRSYEIVVANNNSSDNTAGVAEAAGARVVLERHQQIAANRNAGARIAYGHVFVFVDADTTLEANLLRAAVSALDEGCVGGGALPVFDCEVRGVARFLMRTWHWLAIRRKWACGAFVFCRRDAFETVGGFDERYYCSEEIHLSKALRKWGKKHNREFVILKQSLVTSGRKLQWYSPWQTIRVCAGLLIPGAMRRPTACAFWYTRPDPHFDHKKPSND